MSHGRLVRTVERSCLLIAAIAFAATATACGPSEPASDPDPQDDGRNWAVSSDDSAGEAAGSDSNDSDAGTRPDATGADVDDRADAGSVETDVDPDATDDDSASSDASPEIVCRAGVADEAAFEGTTRDPAARLTVYIRDDCAAVGSVATSIYSGNYSLTVRGELDDEGNLRMSGRTTRHHAEIDGQLGGDASTVHVEANFEGTDIRRLMTLERIE